MDITAPRLDELITRATQQPESLDTYTKELVHSLFHQIKTITPTGDEDLHKLWLTAPRGAIEDFGDYNEYLADSEVENMEEFEELWLGYYPDSLKWYELTTVSYNDTYTVLINGKLIFQITPESYGYPSYKAELAEWILDAVRKRIRSLSDGNYNSFVSENLPYRKRTGKILREDYWRLFPEENDAYLKGITHEEIMRFENANPAKTKDALNSRLPSMTSGMFFEYCRLGYEANRYQGIVTMTAKELYYAHADRRDDGLLELDEDSAGEFSAWFNDEAFRGGHPGHPWEVCRGGNSTHISLYVEHDDRGWWLTIAGSSYSRSIETIKFYLALVENRLPVILRNGRELLAMVTGQDYIGIVPEDVFPQYCSLLFPEDEILHFMHLPSENIEKMIKKTEWTQLEDVKLIVTIETPTTKL